MSIQGPQDPGKMDKEALYGTTWSNPKWNPLSLNAMNILDYFGDRTNPFYERGCNNEIIKTQRLHPDQIFNMTGTEYVLLFCQEPLFIIRKNHRNSPTQVVPLALYYVINGIAYQAPDLASVINSRLVNSLHYMQSAFHESLSYSRFHPFRGYSWQFPTSASSTDSSFAQKQSGGRGTEEQTNEQSTAFQRQNVDHLIASWSQKYPVLPPPNFQQANNVPSSQISAPNPSVPTSTIEGSNNPSVQIKTERTSPAIEKK